MRKTNQNKGITLIALVITIIVMLILVGVSISMAVNGGLFGYAGRAVGDTENKKDQEKELANGKIEIQIGDETYNSIDEFLEGKPIEGHDGETFSEPYEKTVTNNYKDPEGQYATIPAGFSVGTSEGIDTISTGLVIRDENGNEFVWIPVKENLEETYSSGTNYYEPRILDDYDNTTKISELYGGKLTYPSDFQYVTEYNNMVDQVNKYGGFYIGRYETTIDSSGKIGSKYDTEVLISTSTMFSNDEGTDNYQYGWYGLYYAQKNPELTSVKGNGTVVQTGMIYGILWDKTMEFINTQKEVGKTTYSVDSPTSGWHIKKWSGNLMKKSGQANPTVEDENGEKVFGDVALNIWDLESNAFECTQEAYR